MTVSIRIIGYDIFGVRQADLLLKENATVKDALTEYLSDNNIGVGIKELSKSQFIINNKACNANTVLADGDSITVIRILGGG